MEIRCYGIKPVRTKEGRVLLEDSFKRWQFYQGKIMHATGNNFSVLYVKKPHRLHIYVTKTPPTLLFLASWPSYTKASFHSQDSFYKSQSVSVLLYTYVNQAEIRKVKKIQFTYKCKIL